MSLIVLPGAQRVEHDIPLEVIAGCQGHATAQDAPRLHSRSGIQRTAFVGDVSRYTCHRSMEIDERAKIVRSFGSGGVSKALTVVSMVYLGATFLEGSGSRLPARWLPRPVLYFTQDAALFPRASQAAIEYRAEGWLCESQRWTEIDTRPYFPINANDKENRFDRTLFFYSTHRPTIHALDAFLVEHYNAAGHGGSARIGGVRLCRVRVPFGTPGDGQPRYERRPLDAFPTTYRYVLYQTPLTKREEHCETPSS